MRTIKATSWIAAFAGTAIALAAPAAVSDETCKGTVYLTIDTGSMSHAEHIGRVLKEENVKATFFIANEYTVRKDYSLDPSWDGYWKALAEDGHTFGNHTWTHRWARRDADNKVMVVDQKGSPDALDQKAFCSEMNQVNAAFKRATGKNLSGIWRAPGGRTTHNTIRFAASCGYPVHVHWDDTGFLGDELPSEQYPNKLLLERALKNVKSGDVLMMHTGIRSRKEPFALVLQPLIQGLKARGLCFATLGDGSR